MKKIIIFIFSLYFLNSFSQDVGMGVGYESTTTSDAVFESVLLVNIDLILAKNNILFGLDVGIGLIGINEDHNYDNLLKVGGRFGYEVYDNLRLIGSVGLNFLTEYPLRYDEFNVLGDNMNNGIATGDNITTPYAKGTLSYRIGNFAPELGFGSTGIGLGTTYFF